MWFGEDEGFAGAQGAAGLALMLAMDASAMPPARRETSKVKLEASAGSLLSCLEKPSVNGMGLSFGNLIADAGAAASAAGRRMQ